MSTFIINGGKPLKGIYPVSGAKNAGPKLPIAALLSNQKCAFHNIPHISDTEKTILALRSLGCTVDTIDKNTIKVTASHILRSEIPPEAMGARQAVLFIGATLARTGRVVIPPPKGDAIGKRPLNRHLDGIKALGGTVTEKNNHIEISMPQRPQSTTYTFEKNTHCGTENLLLASVFNTGKVILKNAAEEPEINNLIECLNGMGARIQRIKPRVIEIRGVEPLLNKTTCTSLHDRLEMATALVLSIMTGGNIKIENANKKLLCPFLETLNNIGVEINFKKNTATVATVAAPLKPTTITTNQHPGFMTDWQPLITLLLAHMSNGTSTIYERIYETRWRYLNELKKMGVRYDLFHPSEYGPEYYNFNDSEYRTNEKYAARIHGPTDLKPTKLNSHDVRAGINMLLASLVAPGESVIYDPHNHIDRGYENIVEKLKNLGADIKRV